MAGRIRFCHVQSDHENNGRKNYKSYLVPSASAPYPGMAVVMVNHETNQSSLHLVAATNSSSSSTKSNVWHVEYSYSTILQETIPASMMKPIFHFHPSKKLAITYGSYHPSIEECTRTIYQIHTIPSPLYSLQVTSSHNNNNNNSLSQLEQGYIKRCWIGTLVLTTSTVKQNIPIPTSYQQKLPILQSKQNDDSTNNTVTVTSSQPKQKDTFIGMIVPSTIITIHPTHKNDAVIETKKDNTNVEMNETMQFIYDICDMFFKYKDKNDLIPRSILLTGPPGVGKTFAVKTVYGQLLHKYPSLHLKVISGNDTSQPITSKVQIVFFDEVDALCIHSMGRSYLSQWFTSTKIMIVAATNHVESIPHFLRRRFDYPYYVPPPNSSQRLQILKSLLPPNHITTNDDTDNPITEEEEDEDDLIYINHRQTKNKSNVSESLEEISKDCVGYVAADLAALVRTSMTRQISLREAMSTMRPSALRAVMEVSRSSEEIVGEVGGAKLALQQAMKWPRLKPRQFASLNLSPPKGILLYGPPGCAKTSLAKSAALTSGYAFVSLNPAQVLATSFVGDAEATIRRAFASARQSSPCILFVDEMDAILGTGGNIHRNDNGSNSRILSTFLNEMDGITNGSNNSGVLVLGATNRPQTLDAALLRPGRLDQLIYVPPPNHDARRVILQSFFAGSSLSPVEMDELVHMSNDMTGAELVGACRHAILTSLQQQTSSNQTNIPFHHIQTALNSIQPLLRTNPSIVDQYIQFSKMK